MRCIKEYFYISPFSDEFEMNYEMPQLKCRQDVILITFQRESL